MLVLLYENIALEAMSSLPGQILDLIVNSRIIVLLNITSLYASAMIPKSESTPVARDTLLTIAHTDGTVLRSTSPYNWTYSDSTFLRTH